VVAVALVVAGGAESYVHPYGNRFPNGDFPAALAIQPDGKLVVAGSLSFGTLLVTRFGSDGSVDPSFGSSGRVLTTADQRAVSVAVDSERRIVVLGLQHLLRFLPDGQLDETFGDHGVVTLASGEFAAMALQPDGMIVVGGRTSATPWSFLLERLRPDGTPDPGFGSGGVVTTAFQYFAQIRGLALQPDGRLLAVGADTDAVGSTGTNVVALARYLTDGQLDPSFGSGGRVRTASCGSGGLGGTRVAVSSDGRITAAGTSVVRYLADGSLDPTFAGGQPVPLGLDTSALSLQPDGTAIVTGYGTVVHVLADGTFDRSFGVGGVADPGQSIVAAALDSAGRMDIAGATPDPFNSHIAMARLFPDGRPDRSFIPPQGTTVEELRTLSTPGGGLRTLFRADRIPAAALSPDHRRLAFVRSVDDRLELDVIGADGTGLRQLLVSPFNGDELQAGTTLSWSPDGRRVAFDAWSVPLPASSSCSAMPAGQGATYLINVANGQLQRLATGTTPQWSPDGRRIAFQDGLTLRVERPDGSGRRVIGAGSELAWSPGGSRVAFRDPHQWIAVVNVNDRHKRRLAIGRMPVWSPGGGRIAYQRNDCPAARNTDCLLVIGSDGKGFHQLTSFRGASFGPVTWSRNGTQIVVPASLRPSQPAPANLSNIAVVAVNTGKATLYPVGDAPVIPGAPVQWGDGRTFFFVLRNIPGPG
jgi:uncharacterized delta-60 repeat protein